MKKTCQPFDLIGFLLLYLKGTSQYFSDKLLFRLKKKSSNAQIQHAGEVVMPLAALQLSDQNFTILLIFFFVADF